MQVAGQLQRVISCHLSTSTPHSVAHHCALHAIAGLGGSHVDYGTWLRLVLVAVSAVAHMTCWMKLCGGNAALKEYRSCHQVCRCTSRPVRFPQQCGYLLVWRAGPEIHQFLSEESIRSEFL